MAELLTGLEITGYRQFERFTMDGLRRVNLLVGKNNSGKTALLEAVQILTTRPKLGAIQDVLERRGELESDGGSRNEQERYHPSLRHLFPGHRTPDSGHDLMIRAQNHLVSLTFVGFWKEEYFGSPFVSDGQKADAALVVTTDREEIEYVRATRNGLLLDRESRLSKPQSVRFLGTEGAGRVEMARWYDALFEEGRELDAVRSLRILDPRIDGLHFRSLTSESSTEGSGILLSYELNGRHPIGSAGEGMRRVLGLALALGNAKGGVLLVDEIDTGLHYSVMGDLWRLIVETARRLDVQVFATTHSKDCVEGLEHLRFKSPKLFEEVAVHTIDFRRGQSVVAADEDLHDAVQLGVELR